jgi:hemerythrin-like domain-containing protein
MPVQIGQQPDHNFTEPLGLLTDCHRRIERFLDVLLKVAAGARGQEMNAEQRRALTASLRYFREAAPKHTADEEQSLFPRMRAAGGPEVEAALAQIESLESDHVAAGALHDEVDRLGELWLSRGQLSSDEADRLVGLTERLAGIYASHIAVEDNAVFPLAQRVLSTAEQRAAGLEMAARRNVEVHSS